MDSYFLEVDHAQICKHGFLSCGDTFYSIKNENGIICILADGLGSGIKASVLSTLTTTMAAGFISSKMDIKRAAEIILETLPVCSYRKIGYSTFTIIEANNRGDLRVIEHDNPPYALMRNGKCTKVEKQEIPIKTFRKSNLYYSELHLQPGDRVVYYSDGVTQSGMGLTHLPLGWMESGVEDYIENLLTENPAMSASEISHRVAYKAKEYDGNKAADDISCAALYLRNPRRTMLVTGPPYKREHDSTLAEIISRFEGRKLVCGGTTAEILSRELNIALKVNLKEIKSNSEIPPSAQMDGFDLVSEGTITLSRCLRVLQDGISPDKVPDSAVKRLVAMLLDSDIIECVVGTKINDAHQDPALPKDLEIRRNLMKQLCKALEQKYMKSTKTIYI
ncbi:MAG: SpoIIE family protein phosphatase [Candidatus Cloacimonetes bacterium]|nr:SpoIIE family protein phosphatase [Candidatus Cloacimonadota bacterium]MDD4687477.1 SpoIIE family protein phosphatase [Candidatus Cloacimonadota bacterium]